MPSRRLAVRGCVSVHSPVSRGGADAPCKLCSTVLVYTYTEYARTTHKAHNTTRALRPWRTCGRTSDYTRGVAQRRPSLYYPLAVAARTEAPNLTQEAQCHHVRRAKQPKVNRPKGYPLIDLVV